MPNAWSAIDCVEEAFETTEQYSWANPMSQKVRLRCAFADRYDLVNDLLGTPRPYPYHDTMLEPPIAQSCGFVFPPQRGEIVAGDNGLVTYSDVLVDVTYGYDATVDLVAESIESAANFTQLPYWLFRWGSASGDAVLEAEQPGRINRSLILSRTLYQRSSVPAIVIDGVGGVNNAPYSSSILGRTFPTDTLMLAPAMVSRRITTNGSTKFTIAMKLIFKRGGWNKVWRASSGAYEEIWIAGGARYFNYPQEDFSTLLF